MEKKIVSEEGPGPGGMSRVKNASGVGKKRGNVGGDHKTKLLYKKDSQVEEGPQAKNPLSR